MRQSHRASAGDTRPGPRRGNRRSARTANATKDQGRAGVALRRILGARHAAPRQDRADRRLRYGPRAGIAIKRAPLRSTERGFLFELNMTITDTIAPFATVQIGRAS